MRDFFKYTFASFLGFVLFSTVGIVGLLLLLVVISTTARESPTVEDKSILVFDLSTNITDSKPDADPSEIVGAALSGRETSSPIALRHVLNALTAAAKDDRIVGLYLSGSLNSTGSGLATLGEVRQALQAFRQAGKPIFAYETSWAERDYYLTSVADTVLFNPTGLLEMNGFKSETLFFGGALQKYGVGVQAIRVGQYKSAVEPFIRNGRSPADRQQTEKLLSDLWGEFLTAAAKSRNLTPQKIQAIADNQGLLLANEAQTAGFVDKVAYTDEVLTALQKVTGEDKGEDSFRHINLPEYAESVEQDADPSNSKNQIALIYAEGEIVSGEGGAGQVGGDRLAKTLRKLRLDKAVKAIVLRVNSPGGSATASDVVAREVLLTTRVKPVIVSMGNLAASGGYEISTYASKIFASPTTITGSIGVFGLLPNFQQIASKNGVTWDVVKTGKYADIETISRPRTPPELAIEQRVVDQFYGHFVDIVAESRSLPRQRVAEIAQGRVWSGIEAKHIGLVDQLGGLEASIRAAAAQAKLGNDWRVEEYPKTSNFEAQLLQRILGSHLAQAASAADPISVKLQEIKADLETLKAMNDPQGMYTRLPFTPRIH